MPRSRMRSYHFDLGNSTTGPIGFCARIIAPSKDEALTVLRDALPESVEVRVYTNQGDQRPDVEYIEVYLNPRAISTRDIDSVDPVERPSPSYSSKVPSPRPRP